MAFGDYDSDDDDYNNNNNYYSRGGANSNSNKPSSSRSGTSILKNSYSTNNNNSSSIKKPLVYSDDDDDDMDNYNSGRLSNPRNAGYSNNRYSDSPVNSHRSTGDSKSAKPPSGRMPPLQPISTSARTSGNASTNSSTEYGKRQPTAPTTITTSGNFKSSGSGNHNSYGNNNDPDSDDSFMQRYQKFTKAKNDPPQYNDYDTRGAPASSNTKFSSSKYDPYDEDEKSRYISRQILSYQVLLINFFLLQKDYLSAMTELNRSSNQTSLSLRNNRSSSLDRLNSGPAPLTSTMLSQYGNSSLPRSKFNSTTNINGLDNASDRSYTINSMNSTSMSVREAKSR